MKIVIAPNAFKECLSPLQAAQSIREGVLRACADSETVMLPLADGGDGTVEALAVATAGRIVRSNVSDPLGRSVQAEYGILGDGRTAVIEMAEASGLKRLVPEERNPLVTSTRGTGELIVDALSHSVGTIIVGIGGSATVDGGTGMARAFGYQFLDANGEPIPEGGGALERLDRIEIPETKLFSDAVEVVVACDVDNPLLGESGAARVFGPQKGATPEMVEQLERGLARLACVMKKQFGLAIADRAGAGAAGGLGAGLVAFARARLESGSALILKYVRLQEVLRGADLVITGEGRVDRQTGMGKLPAVVAQCAKQSGIPVVVLAGALGEGHETMFELGTSALFAVQQGPQSERESMKDASALLSRCAEQVCRLFIARPPEDPKRHTEAPLPT